jgi:large subunit ribosomal protein L23
MKNIFNTIIKPLQTEKSNKFKKNFKLTIIVSKKSTKQDIKHAIFKIFKIKVVKINTCIYRGKIKRIGKTSGKCSNWKKAIITMCNLEDLNQFSEFLKIKI